MRPPDQRVRDHDALFEACVVKLRLNAAVADQQGLLMAAQGLYTGPQLACVATQAPLHVAAVEVSNL